MPERPIIMDSNEMQGTVRSPESEVSPEEVTEFSLIIMKPMAVENDLQGIILEQLIKEGQCEISHMKYAQIASREQVSDHYSASQYDNEGAPRPHFPALVNYISNKCVDVLIINDRSGSGQPFTSRLRRDVIGPSDPAKTEDHHIRSLAKKHDYIKPAGLGEHEQIEGRNTAIDNLIHCSDSPENALREIMIWFKDEPEIQDKV